MDKMKFADLRINFLTCIGITDKMKYTKFIRIS